MSGKRGYVLMLDTRLGGCPEHFYGDPAEMMGLPALVTKSAIFLCWKENLSLRYAATAFLLGVQDLPDLTSGGLYIVTAAHVLDNIQRKRKKSDVFILVNPLQGDRICFKTRLQDWFRHPTNPLVDVAVLPFPGWQIDQLFPYDHILIPFGNAPSKEVIEEEGIRAGTDVFITWLFFEHTGTKRLKPIVRVGNIALMPDPEEPIWIEWGGKKGSLEAYLIECRSLDGLSGSPAFVSLENILWVPGSSPLGGPLRPILSYEYYWIGLVHGHWTGDRTALDISGNSNEERLNTGIAVVIPSSTIMEVVNQSRLADMRKEQAKTIRRNAPVPDNLTNRSRQKTKKGLDIPIPTESEVLDVFKKATQKRTKK
jgi:hypothetical protein